MSAAPSSPIVSVIIPAHNAGRRLHDVVEGLRRQTIGREWFEVIVADDGSHDQSINELEKLIPWLSVSRANRSNSYAARNRAAALASAKYFAFCDADCIPEPDWLDRGIRALADADIAAGEVRYEVGRSKNVWTLLSLDILFDQREAVRRGRALGGNLFVRRSIFDQLGGFDESLPSGGDGDFVARATSAGASLVFVPEALVHHPTHDSARPFLRRIWFQNRARATRVTRAGGTPPAARLRWWVPLIPSIRARRRLGRTLRLDRSRLGPYGLRPTLLQDLTALFVLYLVVPYVSGPAQLVGWRNGVRATGSVVIPEALEREQAADRSSLSG